MTKPASQALRERVKFDDYLTLTERENWGRAFENDRLMPVIEALLASRERLREQLSGEIHYHESYCRLRKQAEGECNCDTRIIVNLLTADDEAMRALIGEG